MPVVRRRSTTRSQRNTPRCVLGVQLVVLAELLARRGIDSRVVIGVKPGPSFGAHAWVESIDGQALLEPLAHEHHRLVEI